MKQRKQYVVDKKFQFRQAYSVVGLFLLVVAVIVIIIGINAVLNGTRLSDITKKNDDLIKSLDAIMVTQDEIVATEMAWVQNPRQRPSESVIREVAKEHYKNISLMKAEIGTVQENITAINRIIRINFILLFAIIALIVVQCVITFFIMIRKTHKMSGPLYVISHHIREIIAGRMPIIRPLRHDDEFQDFYELFTKMVNALKEREGKI